MTRSLRDFYQSWTVMAVSLCIFLLLFGYARADGWVKEIAVTVWCYDADILMEVVSLTEAGEADEANAAAAAAFESERCVSAGFGAAFRPNKVVAAMPNFAGEAVVIIRGNLIRPDDTVGREAFVLSSADALSRFKPSGQTAGFPEPTGPEYYGWQDV